MHVFVCVCVCVCERERENKTYDYFTCLWCELGVIEYCLQTLKWSFMKHFSL